MSTNAMPGFWGSGFSNSMKASRPPADAPTPTTTRDEGDFDSVTSTVGVARDSSAPPGVPLSELLCSGSGNDFENLDWSDCRGGRPGFECLPVVFLIMMGSNPQTVAL